MLTSDNMPYASAEWLRDRKQAIRDRSSFTTAELTVLEVADDQGYGNENPDGYKIETSPVDPKTEPTETSTLTQGKTKGAV